MLLTRNWFSLLSFWIFSKTNVHFFSQALFNLVSFDADHVLSRLENIIEHLYAINLNLRHGSILCLGEIIHALYIVKNGQISYGTFLQSFWLSFFSTFFKKKIFFNTNDNSMARYFWLFQASNLIVLRKISYLFCRFQYNLRNKTTSSRITS